MPCPRCEGHQKTPIIVKINDDAGEFVIIEYQLCWTCWGIGAVTGDHPASMQ